MGALGSRSSVTSSVSLNADRSSVHDSGKTKLVHVADLRSDGGSAILVEEARLRPGHISWFSSVGFVYPDL